MLESGKSTFSGWVITRPNLPWAPHLVDARTVSRGLGGRLAQRGDEVTASAAVAATTESDGAMMTAKPLRLEAAMNSEDEAGVGIVSLSTQTVRTDPS